MMGQLRPLIWQFITGYRNGNRDLWLRLHRGLLSIQSEGKKMLRVVQHADEGGLGEHAVHLGCVGNVAGDHPQRYGWHALIHAAIARAEHQSHSTRLSEHCGGTQPKAAKAARDCVHSTRVRNRVE